MNFTLKNGCAKFPFKETCITIVNSDYVDEVLDIPRCDAVITDPPYNETSLDWDKSAANWIQDVSVVSDCLWTFGSARMLLTKSFEPWRFAQDVIWQKHNGSSPRKDRFRRVHEHIFHFYQGKWNKLYHEPVFTMDATKRTVRRQKRPPHWGHINDSSYESKDGGPRLKTSVFKVRSCHGHAIHPTQKPVALFIPLIHYSVPKHGTFFDPFLGSGSSAIAAIITNRSLYATERDPKHFRNAVQRINSFLKDPERELSLLHKCDPSLIFQSIG